MKKMMTLVLTIIFAITMITLTIFARKIKNSFILPNVSTARLTTEQFETSFVLEDGTVFTRIDSNLAINKEIYDKNEQFFIIEHKDKNGEPRTYAKLISLMINGENEVSYRVDGEKSSITKRDYLIITSSEILSDGDEVFVADKPGSK